MQIIFLKLRKRENNKMGKKKDKSLYDGMVEELSTFVIRTAGKDNPMPAELNAMVEITKILFRTI